MLLILMVQGYSLIVSKINEKAGTDYKIGYVNTFSFSAHIYQHDWKQAKELVDKFKGKIHEFVEDPKGNFIIYNVDSKVTVEHRKGDKLISKKESKNFHEIYNWIKSFSLLPEHALYLGKELFRAFDYLKRKKKYVQDRV